MDSHLVLVHETVSRPQDQQTAEPAFALQQRNQLEL